MTTRSGDWPSAVVPISVFVLLAQCVASLQNLPDFLSVPVSLLEDSRNEAALALISSLDANDSSTFATVFPFVPSRRMQTVIAAAQQRLTLLQRSLPSLSTTASSAPSDLAPDQVQWAYDGSTCLAIAKGHVSIQGHVSIMSPSDFAPFLVPHVGRAFPLYGPVSSRPHAPPLG